MYESSLWIIFNCSWSPFLFLAFDPFGISDLYIYYFALYQLLDFINIILLYYVSTKLFAFYHKNYQDLSFKYLCSSVHLLLLYYILNPYVIMMNITLSYQLLNITITMMCLSLYFIKGMWLCYDGHVVDSIKYLIGFCVFELALFLNYYTESTFYYPYIILSIYFLISVLNSLILFYLVYRTQK